MLVKKIQYVKIISVALRAEKEGSCMEQSNEEKVMHRVCHFCNRDIAIRNELDMPIMDPETGFSMCNRCLKNIYQVITEIEEENRKHVKTDFLKDIGKVIAKIKPHIIKQYLDQYIINQERAKKILSVAVYNHYKRMMCLSQPNRDGLEIEKSNVVMIGPSGSGKTAMLMHLSKLLDVPFAVTDASSLTEAGFVGADVEVAVRNLYYAADKNIDKTEHGIIYLDEFDKIARKSGPNQSITADPGHEGVQQALLKMLEGNVVEFTARGQRKHPEAPTIKVNTTNILFIVGGAFVGLEDIIEKRLHKNESPIGFGAKITKTEEETSRYDRLISQVAPEDLIQFGIIPEVVGRLPIICTLETLDKEALLRILTEPKNAPTKQYAELMRVDNIELEFTEEALLAIADKAIKRKTGARGLKGILEDVMLDIMYEIPKSTEKRRVIIEENCITEGSKPRIEVLPEK